MTDPEISEEQLQALEAEMERIRVEDVILQTIVTLLNLGARKAGLAKRQGDTGDTKTTPDYDQVQMAIESTRALIGLLGDEHAEQARTLREGLAQLQRVYAQNAPKEGGKAAAKGSSTASTERQEGGSAVSSGRLWVPGRGKP